MKTFACLTLCSAALLLTTGCADSAAPTAAAAEVINTHCPIMGEEIENPEEATTVEWNGKKVAFCCPPCEDEWARMTDEEREAALAKAESGEGAGHGDHDHDHGDAHDHGEGHEDHAEHGEASEEHGEASAEHGEEHPESDEAATEAGEATEEKADPEA
ncbi:MAG: hypothetical protein Fues2KO_46440 [Fuerstiella sp.]